MGSDSYVVRDVTDINHPFTVSTLGGLTRNAASSIQFATGTDVSYYDSTAQLIRKSFDGAPVTVTHTCAGGLFGFAWNQDGTTVVYATDRLDVGQGDLRMVSSGQDRSIGPIPIIPLTGCLPPCEEFVDMRALYSPDNKYFSFASSWTGPFIYVWTSDGRVVKTMQGTDHSGPSFGVWSGSGLFFRDKQGVEVWRSGSQTLVLPGVAWIRPRASSGSTQIVYEAKDASGIPGVFLLDVSTNATRKLASLRSEPAFLNPTTIWYRGERQCQPGDQYPCGAEATWRSGKTYVYDLKTGTESESIITDVWDVWPHPA